MASTTVSLNPNVAGLGKSATLAINELSRDLQSQGKTVYRLGLGQSPFPVPQIMVDALQAHAHEKDYLAVQGLPALREAIADFYKRTQGLNYSADNVIVAPGSKELMFMIQLAFDAELLVPEASWVSYVPQAQIIGRPVTWIPSHSEVGTRINLEAFESICAQAPERNRLLILNYPCNPTGLTYDEDYLKAIADIARRYNVTILSDEIYSELTFKDEHLSIAKFYPEGTVISNGLSKWAGAGGWRLGTFLFPENLKWLLDAMCVIASETFTSVSAPIQYASVHGFAQSDEMDNFITQQCRILAVLMPYLAQRLRNMGAKLEEPEGAFYVMPSFEALRPQLEQRGIKTGREFATIALKEAGFAALPSIDFGRPEEELGLRIACINFDGEKAIQAAQQTDVINETFLREYCADTVAAFDSLETWLKSA